MRQILTPLLGIISIICGSCGNIESRCHVTSPSGELILDVTQGDDGIFTYNFTAEGRVLIDNSQIGYQIVDGELFPSADWHVADVDSRSHDGVWTPQWGKRSSVVDLFNETTITLKSDDESTAISEMKIVLRAYDDGVAFRYVIPEVAAASVAIESESTQYNFAEDFTAWFFNMKFKPIEPELLSEANGTKLPVVTIDAGNDQFFAIHEANLHHTTPAMVGDEQSKELYITNESPLELTSKKGSTLFETKSSPKMVFSGYESAWRVMLYGNSPGEMVDSHIIELLSPDPDPNIDFSWVTTGVSVWDWRMDGAVVDDFTYTMSYPTWIRAIDFASEEGIPFLMIDANWYGPEFHKDSDPLVGEKAEDVKRLIKYGEERGVGIWLYLNDVGGRAYPLEKTLEQYGLWGATGVKYGFMVGDRAERLARTQLVTRLCAENRLLVDFHDNPIHPDGQMRTWPNAVTREYCHAQLDAHKVFVPETFLSMVFVNMIAGPLDMNNGMFDLRQGPTTRVDEKKPVPSTLVSEAARTAIVFSGTTVIPDIPEYYRKYPSLLRFISAQKMPWLESKTLSGVIGEHIIMMRESDKHYLVAAAINEKGGELTIPMDFLPSGEFKAELSTDGEGAHYLKNRETLNVDQVTVRRDKDLTVKLAPGGGCTLLIEKR